MRIYRDEQAKQIVKMVVPHVGFGARHRSPQRHGHIHLTDAAPIQESAVHVIAGVPPEPGVVDVRVPVAQRDVVGLGSQMVPDRGLVLQESRRVVAQSRQELGRAHVGGKQSRMRGGEFGEASQPAVQPIRRQRLRFADRGGR